VIDFGPLATPPLSPRLEALVVEVSKRMISPNSGLISSLLLRRLRPATGDSFEYDDDRGKGSAGPADEARSGCVGGENFLGARDCGWGGHLVLSCIILHSTIISKTLIDIVERGIRFVGFTCTPTCVLWQDHSKYFMIHIGSSMIITCKYLQNKRNSFRKVHIKRQVSYPPPVQEPDSNINYDKECGLHMSYNDACSYIDILQYEPQEGDI